MNRLKEKELLGSSLVQTYERKVGLAEKLLFFRSVPNRETELKEILDKIPVFYHYASSYGRYDGITVYAMYPISLAHMVTRLAEEMKESGLIQDFYEFDLLDYVRKGADIDAFLPDSTWTWETWYDEIDATIKNCDTVDLHFEEFPQVVNFDFMDIRILMHLVEDAEMTLKQLSEKLELSQPQVHKRIKNLEDNGIIRGYKPSFRPLKEYSMVYVIFTSHKHAEEILCAFHKLPFFVTFSMENKSHYFIHLAIPSSDTDRFLQGVNKLKQYADELFIQNVLKGTHKGHVHLLKMYNEGTKQWDIPVGDYLGLIQKKSDK